MRVLLLALLSLNLAALCDAHDDDGGEGFWHSFIRRPKFKDRLLYHPETGEKLQERYAASCNLTAAWGQQVGAAVEEYYIVMTSPTTFAAEAITAGNWSTGLGTFNADTGFIQIDFDKSSAQGTLVNGTVVGCGTIIWDNGSTWKKLQHISKVHVVFMNHLDIGFAVHTPEGNPIGFIANVVNTYTMDYFPAAATLSKLVRALEPDDSFIYTTHPWLVSFYINCPPNIYLANGTRLWCPPEEDKQAFREAVQRGDITWHDGPCNIQSEIAGWDTFFEWSLELTNHISKELGLSKPKNKVYNLRDVPGTTRAVIPLLVKNGFTTITIGQNQGTPATGGWYPHKIFLWKDKATGTEILTLNHAGGYPNSPGPDPLNCGGLCREDCMMADGFDEALCFAFRTDNSGPPTSVQEVANIFQILRVEFPGANVIASTLHAFSDKLNASPARKNLEVITQEVGDTWIQGASTDPLRYAKHRAFIRQLEAATTVNISDPRIYNMTRFLLSTPEHSAGLSGAGNFDKWTNVDFTPIRKHTAAWANQNNGWEERRVWIDLAVQALDDHPVRPGVEQALNECELDSSKPSTDGFDQVDPFTSLTCKGVEYRFTSSCAMDSLVLGGKIYADKEHLMGELVYSTYTEEDFDNMAKVYKGPTGGGCGYFKPNMSVASHCTHGDYKLTNVQGHVWVKRTTDGDCTAYCRGQFAAVTHSYYGAPDDVWTEVHVVNSNKVQVTLRNYNKTTTRLAEAMHYTFSPTPQDGAEWVYNKLGQKVDPYDTIWGGNPKQHVVYPGVDYGRLQINALDASIVSPITPGEPATPFLFSMDPLTPGTITGMGYELWNNIWNVNWAVYYPFKDEPNGDENILSRYELLV